MKKVFMIMELLIGLVLFSHEGHGKTIGTAHSNLSPAQSVYECFKTDETITIDGCLDEAVWRRTPSMPFVGITDGSAPPFLTEGKMIWDYNYLYFGFYFEEPDICGCWAFDQVNCDDNLRKTIPSQFSDPAWNYPECLIMHIDKFAKVFLDPDGDGLNYFEFHVNPLNCVFDAWYKQSFREKTLDRCRFPNVEWKCPGLLTATHLEGTINAPQDVDKGWSVEMAIPWQALAPFTKGSCPPNAGNLWGGHLGRVYRDRAGSDNEYWVWPFLGIRDCHLPARHGKIIFKDKLAKFNRFFAWSRCGDENYIRRASNIGVTDIITYDPPAKFIKTCAQNKINVYAAVTLSPGLWKTMHPELSAPLQKMTDEEERVCAILRGDMSTHIPEKLKEGWPAKPEEYILTNEQRKLLDDMGRQNQKLQREYQWGGEPEIDMFSKRHDPEVLTEKLLCFQHPEVKELLQQKIREILSLPGIKGIAFDYIGYQNYKNCNCPLCISRYQKFCQDRNLPQNFNSQNLFSLESLVNFNNELVDYIHSVKPEAATVNHVYPVYLPEPLYGNRLKIDICGQTASWYSYWDLWRIQKYSNKITTEQNRYWPKVKGAAFLGYYDSKKRIEFPTKSPARCEAELRAILRGGSDTLMMCNLNDLLDNPDVAEICKRFCVRIKDGQK